jgi:hypothetical protein
MLRENLTAIQSTCMGIRLPWGHSYPMGGALSPHTDFSEQHTVAQSSVSAGEQLSGIDIFRDRPMLTCYPGGGRFVLFLCLHRI